MVLKTLSLSSEYLILSRQASWRQRFFGSLGVTRVSAQTCVKDQIAVWWTPGEWSQGTQRFEVSPKAKNKATFFTINFIFTDNVVQSLSCVWVCNPMDCSMPTRLPCQSLTPGVCSNSCPLSRWCHSTIASFVTPFLSCPQSFPESGSFPVSWLLALGGQSIGASASASVLPMNIQGWFPFGLTGLISLLSKGLSRVFSNTTIWKHQFLGNSWGVFKAPLFQRSLLSSTFFPFLSLALSCFLFFFFSILTEFYCHKIFTVIK